MKNFKEYYKQDILTEQDQIDDYLVYVDFGVSSIQPDVIKWNKKLPLKSNDTVSGGSAEFFPDEKSALSAHNKVVKYIKKIYEIPYVKNSDDISFFKFTVMTIKLNGTDISRKSMFTPSKNPYTIIKSTLITHNGIVDGTKTATSVKNMRPILKLINK